MNEVLIKLKKLFVEKKYSELIFLIENDIKDRSARLLNILATSRLARQKNKESFIQAISEFKQGYLKEKQSELGLECLKNFINSVVDFYDYQGRFDNSDFFESYFNECLNFFKEADIYFGYDPKLVSSAIRVFNRTNNLDKALFYYDLLFKNNDLTVNKLASWIFYNNYKKNWAQSDYLKYSNFFNSYLNIFSENKLYSLFYGTNEKRKIGFLSGDINNHHSITFFLKSVLKNYDKKKYEVHLYLNNKIEDQDTENFKKLVDFSINISEINDLDAINLIRKNNLDIMIDLMGITSVYNRITLFKNRLARTQISWLGYCNTTGLNEMDYLIADPNLIYPEEKIFYSEKVIYLPEIWNSHSGFELERNHYPLPQSMNKQVTFGSFNNFNKINDDVIKVWSNILNKVEGSKLILKSSTKKEINRMKKIFGKYTSIESISFLKTKKSFKEHLYLYKNIDIALDTFPYNGVTTSFEAIWMGVPVLVMKGFNFNSRCGESINKNLGLVDLISNDEIDYVYKAVDLANDKYKLLEIRKKIFDNAITSSLFDAKRFTNNFFNLLEKI